MHATPLHDELLQALRAYRAARNFDPATWVAAKCAKLNAYMAAARLTACVTNISGGVDSAVVLALCARAMQCAGSPICKNVGVCQPIHSSAWSLQRGEENIAACGATKIVVDQSQLHHMLSETVDAAVGVTGGDFAQGQLRSYMRVPVVYYVAQLYAQAGTPAIVMGTGNMDEDFYLGYFCKAGDGVVDVQLISDLHKSEVFAVGAYLGVPNATLHAAPSADLWADQTDEDELGFTYDFVELYTGWYLAQSKEDQDTFLRGLSADAHAQMTHDMQLSEQVHKRNAHKLRGIVNL